VPIVKSIALADEGATRAFAIALARRPALRCALVTLEGDLGAGKTTLVRHLLQALGVQGRIKSPTYAVLESYAPGRPGQAAAGDGPALASVFEISHFDFYRFSDPREFEDAGFREVFAAPGLKLVEWPARAGAYLPAPDLRIAIALPPLKGLPTQAAQPAGEQARTLTLTALTTTGAELIA
jgi:tRNA threonylcarbamoyladenosine biosynthesis protein TsaE